MELQQVLMIASSILGIFLLVLSYTYIDKLEKMGCPCSESKYRKFIKNFSLFAAAYLFILMFVSPTDLPSMLGPQGAIIFKAINFVIFVAFFVYFVLALMYTRNLITEKCQCSEDIRREVMYVYSIVEVIILSLTVVLGVLLSLVSGAVAVALAAVNNVDNKGHAIVDVVRNPLGHLRDIPKSIKSIPKSLKSVASSIKKSVKRK